MHKENKIVAIAILPRNLLVQVGLFEQTTILKARALFLDKKLTGV